VAAAVGGGGSDGVWYYQVECDNGMPWAEAAQLAASSAHPDGGGLKAVGPKRRGGGGGGVVVAESLTGFWVAKQFGRGGRRPVLLAMDPASASPASVASSSMLSLRVFSPATGGHVLRRKALLNRSSENVQRRFRLFALFHLSPLAFFSNQVQLRFKPFCPKSQFRASVPPIIHGRFNLPFSVL
jgi:hypothetical protein